ncbi:YgfZ/GcvT domain-containing protein [Arenimonas daejeonensis]|uniref:CAF17-like 4Fe-4S cluster assembly/insertion protein YgfZ n=1 Tax=Arenimonas daejeonensis TaxID=370777 RepID=UPI00131518AB|nr:folate-binding protein [Arenimonas daejeonensis]
MTFKTNLPAASCPALSGFGVLDIRGADAAAFLQAQAMNDVATLTPGQWQWNGWLTPKGRVVALFVLLRVAPDHFLAVLPDFPADDLRQRLQRFVFRSKLSLRTADDMVAAAGPQATLPAPDLALGDAVEGWALDFGGDGGARTLWLLPASHPALAPPDAGIDRAWFAADLAHGLPRLPAEAVEAWTPQMLSLGRLSAFSLKKGCYPGQEIVARTHYLGQAKRGLVRLEGQALRPGMSVEGAGVTVGSLVCSDAAGHEGLAVLASDAPDVLATGDRHCRRLPLLGGLARPS